MAELGFRTVNEMIGRSDVLDTRDAADHWKAQGLDLSRLLYKQPLRSGDDVPYQRHDQDHGLERALDRQLIALAQPALEQGQPVEIQLPIRNANRAVGAMLSGRIAKRYGEDGLPPDTVKIRFQGSAGQSFGAFLARGVSLDLEGDTNDYMGKGMSGGRIVGPPLPPGRLRSRGEHNRGQRGVVRRHGRPSVHQRRGRGALLRPQQRGPRRGGERGGPRLRVHDRRRGRGVGEDRPQLRRRDERRRRLCVQ